MAQFRIGDKARMVNCDAAPNSMFHNCNGDVVTILGSLGALMEGHYQITAPAHLVGADGFDCAAPPWRLAPLVDEAADAFLARLKKLGSEPVNAKVTERVEAK